MHAKFFVPFETAKALKAKGYPQTYAAAYYNTFDDHLILITDRDSASCVVEGNMSKPYYVHLANFYTAAATYHEVLDWLESKNELLGIETLCGINAFTKQRHYYVKISIGDCKPIEPYGMRVDIKSKTYRCEGLTREEALNATILKVLEAL